MFTVALFTIVKTCPSMEECVKKHTHTMENQAATKGKEFQSAESRWMNLEPLIQSEAGQEEKDKYHILTQIYGVQKNGTDEIICRAGIEMKTQRMDL